MPATREVQPVTLLDGEPVAPGFRGRRRSMRKSDALIAIAAVVIMAVTIAATVVTAKQSPIQVERSNGGANMGGVAGSVGFGEALY